MDIAIEIVGKLVSEVSNYMYLQMQRRISYVFHHKTMVENFEKKVETLKERRDRVQVAVDAAGRNVEKIHYDVEDWLMKASKMIKEEVQEVKELEVKANKYFIGFIPDFKSRYQLSKKAEEHASAIDQLLQHEFDKVSFPDVPQANASPKDFELFDSRKQVFDEIMNALKDPNTNIIGVYGMAGVGKSTLVREVAGQVQQDKSFDSVVIAVVTQTPDILKIQDQVAEFLGLKLEEKSVAVRAIRLHERLKKEKKILVVLDDVWTRLNLHEVGIPFGDEHKGCTVLLSSRDLILSNEIGAQKSFQIGILREEEAWELFKKMAGNSVESPELQPIATKIAKRCGGLPIAISTVARTLREKELFEWKDAWKQLQRPRSLKEGILKGANSVIEFSYNDLESEELKQTFLLCSLLGHNADIGDLLKYTMGLELFHGVSTVEDARNRLLTVVRHLKASCLLVDSYSNSRFDMHDLVRDVAKSIAAKDNHVFALKHGDVLDDWPSGETWDRICLDSACITSKLPDQLECPKLTLFCMFSRDPSMEIPTNFFKKMKNLRVLDLTRLNFTSLPSSICQLANLRTLCLDQCVLEDISVIGELKSLEILSLILSDIEMLPKEIGRLIKLKSLDLSRCTKLKIIPQGVLSSLSNLEELYMGNSFVQWEAEGHPSQLRNASLAEFKAFSGCLTALEVHIPNAKIIPKDFFFDKLHRYKIFIGEAYSYWDGKIEESRTVKLKLHRSIRHLNAGTKMLLDRAENVHLDERTGVEILLHELEDWNHFRHLKKLHIQNGAMLKYIIKDDDDVIDKIELPQLQSLTLQRLPNFISFCSKNNGRISISPQELPLFDEEMIVPKLETLKLSSINIGRIWHQQLRKSSTFSMQNLTSLIIEGCGNLKHILPYSMVKCLQQLQVFEINNCRRIQEIIAIEEMREQPEVFEIIECRSIQEIGIEEMTEDANTATFSFPRLKILRIERCPELKGFFNKSMCNDITSTGSTIELVLFNEKVAFPRLESLTINDMGSLNKIWHDQPVGISFCSLNHLQVAECKRLLNVFPLKMVGRLEKLERMMVQNCDSLEGIFEAQDPTASTETGISFVFPKLIYLQLHRLPRLKSLYSKKHTTEWPSLNKMWVYGCDNLEIFASESLSLEESTNQQPLFWVNEATFPNLEELKLEWNDIMEQIWHGQMQPKFFCKLKVVEIIKFSEKSVALPQCFFQSLPNLEKLVVNDAPFTHIFQREEEGYGSAMSQLCELRLTKVPELTHIWKEDCQSSVAFCNLRTLEVQDCGKLKNLAPSSMFFANLTSLQVSHCHGFMNLLLCSTAKSLLQLTKMIVTDCEMIVEIVACEGDEMNGAIVFKQLKFLQLSYLLSLKSFCLGDSTIEFPALEKLIVHRCPRMEIFCRGDLSTPKLEQVQLTDEENRQWEGNLTIRPLLEKVGYLGLKHLKFSEIPDQLVELWNRNPEEILEFKSLEFLEVCNSNKLKCLFNPSMASSLIRLQQLEIKRCNNLEVVIKATTTAESVTFPILNSIIIESCPNLTSFCLGSHPSLIEFPSLTKIEVSHCPNITTFVSTLPKDKKKKAIRIGRLVPKKKKNKNDLTAFFCNKVGLPKLEKITLSHLRNVKRIWHDQLHSDSFCKLKELKVEYCDQLTNIFPSPILGVFQKLVALQVTDCGSLEGVFGIKDTSVAAVAILEEVFGIKDTSTAVVAMQLRNLSLIRLPKLNHVWNEDPHGDAISFQNLRKVEVRECWRLKSVFPFTIAKGLQQLGNLTVLSCGVEEIISKKSKALEQETDHFEFNQLSFLFLWALPNLKCFYPWKHTTAWPALKMLRKCRCGKIDIFGQPESQPLFLMDEVIPQLQEVSFSCDEIAMICDGQFAADLFGHIKFIRITSYLTESAVFPFGFLQRFYNLEQLMVIDSNFKELSLCNENDGDEETQVWTLPRVRNLRLDGLYKIGHLWNEDSPLHHICANLETLEVWSCNSLNSLESCSTSFQNLTTLDIWKCEGITELVTSSKAQSLVCLVTMTIRECKMMKEVVLRQGDGELVNEITFRDLKSLELDCLHSLTSFCSGNYTFKFPSLEQVIVNQCPSLKIFCQGPLSTPILQGVQSKKSDSTAERWAGDLNVTIKQLHKKKVWDQCNGLKHLKFSEIPELEDIWNINPQEIVEFKNLEFLEVCNSNDLKCIFNLSIVSSLGRLRQLEIKRCNNLEAVIMQEEEAIQTTDDKSIMFPLLNSIIIEACPDLKSFYWGSLSLIEFPSLSQIEVSHCPNMTSFVSTPSRDEDKQAILIGDGIEGSKNDLTALFCNKVACPRLERMAISHLGNVKRIWHEQLHVNPFCELNELKVEYCDQLLNIFPFYMISGVFGRLETLQVTGCGSLEQVFGIKDTCFVVAMQLRTLNLSRLPKLKSVFPFSIAKGLHQLENLVVNRCGVEEIVSKNSEGILEQGILFKFNSLSYLSLWYLPHLKCFYPGMHSTAMPLLRHLWIAGCEKIKYQLLPLFLKTSQVIPQLVGVSFGSGDIAIISDGQIVIDCFCHIKALGVTSHLTESAVFPFGFLQRFYNLEYLAVYDCNFKELSLCKGYGNNSEEKQVWTLPKVRWLRLSQLYKIKHLWNEDSPMGLTCANLEALEVWYCDSLISLGSSSASFQNLTILDVWKCKGIAELITFSKAQSLERLVKMRIRECETMKEVVASEGADQARYEITFRYLKSLELDCLHSLTSFCSGNYTFKFSSLEKVIVSQCPRLKCFCQGTLSTPKLSIVQRKETDFMGRWAGDLNATIKQIAQPFE